jgi:hypothetical protein
LQILLFVFSDIAGRHMIGHRGVGFGATSTIIRGHEKNRIEEESNDESFSRRARDAIERVRR